MQRIFILAVSGLLIIKKRNNYYENINTEGDRLTHEYHRRNPPSLSVSNDVKDVSRAFGIGCITGVASGQPFGITMPLQNCMVGGATAGTAATLYKMTDSSKDKK